MDSVDKTVVALLDDQLSIEEAVRATTGLGALLGAAYTGRKAYKKGKRGKALGKAAIRGAGVGGALGFAGASAAGLGADLRRLAKYGPPKRPELKALLRKRLKMKALGTAGGAALAAKLHTSKKLRDKKESLDEKLSELLVKLGSVGKAAKRFGGGKGAVAGAGLGTAIGAGVGYKKSKGKTTKEKLKSAGQGALAGFGLGTVAGGAGHHYAGKAVQKSQVRKGLRYLAKRGK